MTVTLQIDTGVISAIENWFKYNLNPGSFTECLIRGNYDRLENHAHELLKPRIKDHILYVEAILPAFIRGGNYNNWRGYNTCDRRDKVALRLGNGSSVLVRWMNQAEAEFIV